MRLFPRTIKDFAFAALRIVAVVYLVILGLLLFGQEKLIFHPSKTPPDFKYHFTAPFEEAWLPVEGIKIHSLYFPVKNAKGLFLYFHGNAGTLEDWGYVAEELATQAAMSVLIIDYPGYGKSEGKITSEEQLHKIGGAAMDAAVSLSGSPSKIVLYGRSIGTGIATKIASETRPAALILESPYFSLRSVAKQWYPIIPLFLFKYDLHSDEWMPKVECPVLILHGTNDEIIPFEQGKRLSGLIKSGAMAVVNGGRHNDLSNFPDYWAALKNFLSQIKFN